MAAAKVGIYGHYDLLDVSMVQLRHQRNKYCYLYPFMRFVNGDASEPPKRKYDVVICYMLLHEVPSATRARIVNNALDCLKPGGKAVFVDYNNSLVWHPLRYVVKFFNRLYQPFAEKLWNNEIKNYARNPAEFFWRKTTFSAACIKRWWLPKRKVCIKGGPPHMKKSPDVPGIFFAVVPFFSERCLSKQGFYFSPISAARIQPFHGAGLLSVISVDVDRKAAFVKRLNKALMFRRQPVFAAENQYRFARTAGFAGHGYGVSGNDDAVGAGVKTHDRVVFFLAPQISVSGDMADFLHDDVFRLFAGAPRRSDQNRTADLIVYVQNRVGQHFRVFGGKRFFLDRAADQHRRQRLGQLGKFGFPFGAGFFKRLFRNAVGAAGDVEQVVAFRFAAVVFGDDYQVNVF